MSNAYTVDSWKMQGFRTQTLHAVKNPCITYCQPSCLCSSSVPKVPPDPWFCIHELNQLMNVCGLKLNIQKTTIMASGLITSWHIDGETMERVTDFIYLGSKTTADDDCSHEIKRCLLFGSKALTNLDSILKSTGITLLTNIHIVTAMVFLVVMYGCESWTIKKAEHRRIDVFELWYWRRLLRVPWTARRSNQSILKEISPEYSLEGLMLKLKL